MNEPTPENNPSDTRKQIAAMYAVLKTHKQLNPQEQAEAIKLKAELERLTNRPIGPGDLHVAPPSPDRFVAPRLKKGRDY